MTNEFSTNSNVSFGVSDVLAVRADQVIVDGDIGRFRKIIIRENPTTKISGTLVYINAGKSTPLTSKDLIVSCDTTISLLGAEYNKVIFFADKTLNII